MNQTRRVGDLEIDEDRAYQRLFWTIQRFGWVGMGLLVLAGLAGLLGPGPLSSTTVGDAALRVEYDRFGQWVAGTTLRVRVERPPAGEGEVRVFLNAAYLKDMLIERVTPEPERVEGGEEGHVYVFNLAEPGRGLDASFHLRPERAGAFRGEVRLGGAGAARVEFDQFIYP